MAVLLISNSEMTSTPLPMTAVKEIGLVEKIPYEIKQIEWRIGDFFAVTEEEKCYRYDSPTFSIANILWHLRLLPNLGEKTESIDLYLCSNVKRDYLVEYYFGLKRYDDEVEQLASGILKGNETHNVWGHFIKKTELLQWKSVLVPCSVLTITCTLKLMTEVSHSTQQTVLHETSPLKLIRLDKLSANFKELCADKESCDVTLKVKNKEYKAHISVLIARSNVFAATFKHETLEKQTGIITISDCDPDSFPEFLEYLYTGQLEELSFGSALNLYYTSDKYDVAELKAFCVKYLMQCLTVENVCDIVVLADKYDETRLFAASQEFFNKNVTKILPTSEWQSLMKKDYRLANKLLIEMSKVKLGD